MEWGGVFFATLSFTLMTHINTRGVMLVYGVLSVRVLFMIRIKNQGASLLLSLIAVPFFIELARNWQIKCYSRVEIELTVWYYDNFFLLLTSFARIHQKSCALSSKLIYLVLEIFYVWHTRLFNPRLMVRLHMARSAERHPKSKKKKVFNFYKSSGKSTPKPAR